MIKTLLKYKIFAFCLNLIFNPVKMNFKEPDIIIINTRELNDDYIGYYHKNPYTNTCYRISKISHLDDSIISIEYDNDYIDYIYHHDITLIKIIS